MKARLRVGTIALIFAFVSMFCFAGFASASEAEGDTAKPKVGKEEKKSDKKGKKKGDKKGKQTKGKKKQEKKGNQGKRSNEPRLCLGPKIGLAMPFSETYSAALEMELGYRLLIRRSLMVVGTGTVGYLPLSSKNPETKGGWMPAYLGANVVFGKGGVRPYAGAGIGLNYVSFDVDPEETDLDLEDGGGSGDDLQEVKGLGVGGRILGGAKLKAGPGRLLFEVQIHGVPIEESFTITPVFYVGYLFCF